MKILTSLGLTFPAESVPTVMSIALMTWRVASETMSEYCDEILAESFRIFWSSAMARPSAPEKSPVNASICESERGQNALTRLTIRK